MNSRSLLASLLALSLAAPAVDAQARALVRELDEFDVYGTDQTLFSPFGLARTISGGWRLDIRGIPSSVVLTLGSEGAEEPPTLFGDPGTATPYERAFPLPDGRVLHTDGDSLFLDATTLVSEGDPVTGVPGATWQSRSSFFDTFLLEGVSPAGQALFHGYYVLADGTEVEGLFVGEDQPPVYTNEVPVGPLGTTGYRLNSVAFSPSGEHFALTVFAPNAGGISLTHVLLDGAVHTLGGSPVVRDVPVPASVGGRDGELWRNFRLLAPTDAGDLVMSGDTDGDPSTDEFLIRDGVMLFREGVVIDGDTMVGEIDALDVLPDGRVVWIWNANFDTGLDQALGIEDRIYIRSNAAVDWDEDGFADEEFTLRGLAQQATVTEDGRLLFVSNVIGPFSIFYEALFELPLSFLLPRTWIVSATSGGSIDFDLDAGPASAGQLYALAGSFSGTEPGFVLGGATIPLNPDAYFTQTLTEANSPTFTSTLGVLDAEGQASAAVVVPPDVSLVGLRGHHAAIRFDVAPFVVHEVSPAVGTELTL